MSRFNANLARWEATGTTPPDSTIQNGWLAGTKPPADWFNWYFNRTYTALKEIQEAAALNADLVSHTANTDNPHSVTKAQLGLSDVENFGIASLDEAKAGIAINKLMTPASVLAAIKEQFNTQNILFEGAAWPAPSTYKFAGGQKVSDQNLGLIFIWSDYDVIPGSASVANNYNFDFTFIPKFFVAKHAGANVNVPVATNFNTSVAQITIKTLYLTDTTFAGHDYNSSGLNANDAILRYIIGV
ncbi:MULTISPECIES: hypothetical protein [Listeria]|uniref:hypothetical protein n=1 Tax=Listeria TaxID=1637 RepID=UPI0004D51542|nr:MULTISPECIES: hypothetical protein [Listeria]AWN07984.1 hypothetical protein [Listeria phage PSU-VKH-LP041]EAA0229952.1 hypothetical protein [Listeria monocytogenes]EAC2935984.1 hypothetical protein [Listeria monocytogenes]EAC3184295.1 hypothetical protein [Listeria monocytogenes]EAC3457128.1 hypothetical protein [Listeria monocytogenes]